MLKKVSKKINGLASFMAILGAVDPRTRQKWLEDVREKAAWLGKLYDKFSFQFEDLARLDDRSLQKLIVAIDEKKLFLAWKLASEGIKARFLENMSKTRSEDFLLHCAKVPKVHKREVFKAQQLISDVAKQQLELGNYSFRNVSKRLR